MSEKKNILNNSDEIFLNTLSNLSENGELIITQVKIAEMLNCHRVTVNRKLKKLKMLGMLDYTILVEDDGMTKQTKIYNIKNP